MCQVGLNFDIAVVAVFDWIEGENIETDETTESIIEYFTDDYFMEERINYADGL